MSFFKEMPTRIWVSLAILIVLTIPAVSQLQQSGGPGSTVSVSNASLSVTQSGTWTVQPGNTANTTPWLASLSAGGNTATISAGGALKVDGSAVTQPVSIASLPALTTGAAIVGYVRTMPSGCSALTSDVVHDTVAVATGAGTSVSSVTGCIESIYVNNITNSAVTFRLADKTGTPVIWVGGNNDFSIPANSNLALTPQLSGITGANGWTAIAGTASALNLHIVTRE